MTEPHVIRSATVTLERLQFALEQLVGKNMLATKVSVSEKADFLYNMFAVRFTRDVYADKLLKDERQVFYKTTAEVEVADRYWKWGFVPASHKRKETVAVSGYVTVRAEHFAAFPDLQKHYPVEFGNPVRFSRLEQA